MKLAPDTVVVTLRAEVRRETWVSTSNLVHRCQRVRTYALNVTRTPKATIRIPRIRAERAADASDNGRSDTRTGWQSAHAE